MRSLCRFGIGLSLVSLLTVSCAPSEDPGATASRYNLVLISVDTLRADHLGCYGYGPPTSPAIDAFCGDSIVFRQAIAQAPSTLHSHASMLASILPHHHAAAWSERTPLAQEALTIAEVLASAGFATAAFTGGGQMDRTFGLNQGFDLYEQPGHEKFAGTAHTALDWVFAHREQRFFAFIHTYEVHHPYRPPPDLLEAFDAGYEGDLPPNIELELLRDINEGNLEIDEADLAHIVATYDAEIRSMDRAFGGLIEALKAADLYDRTLIVLTSDHGEEFGEHERVGWHSHSLFDELLHVPLIIKLPRSVMAGTTVDEQVRSIDIAPSIVSALGVPIPAEWDGVDLFERMQTSPTEELVAVSRLDRPADRAALRVSSIRTSEWKLQTGRLFNLVDDPGELWSAANPAVEGELSAQLDEILQSRTAQSAEAVAPDDKTLQELRALGYVQ